MTTTDETQDLGDAAQQGLGDVPEHEGGQTQGALDGTDYTHVKFTGVSYDSLRADVKIGDVMEFRLRGVVVGVGDEQRKDGEIRHMASVALDRGGTLALLSINDEDPDEG